MKKNDVAYVYAQHVCYTPAVSLLLSDIVSQNHTSCWRLYLCSFRAYFKLVEAKVMWLSLSLLLNRISERQLFHSSPSF